MDADDEMAKFKLMLFVGIIFLVSAYFSWREMKYAMFGTKVDASIVRIYDSTEPGRRGRAKQVRTVEYRFNDEGAERKESDNISIDAPPPSGPTVAIQYLSGTPNTSRLADRPNVVPVIIFFASLGFMGFKIYRLLQESKR